MSPSPTEEYVASLTELGPGDLEVLRAHAGLPLDRSVVGFDLFTSLWWPLRERSPQAPRREAAWLVAKLYAKVPLAHHPGRKMAIQLCHAQPKEPRAAKSFQERFDRLVTSSLSDIEPSLRWALRAIASRQSALDWVALTNDLSRWRRASTRERWVKEFLDQNETSTE